MWSMVITYFGSIVELFCVSDGFSLIRFLQVELIQLPKMGLLVWFLGVSVHIQTAKPNSFA